MAKYKFRKPNKQTTDVLSWAFLWRFILLSVSINTLISFLLPPIHELSIFSIIICLAMYCLITFCICTATLFYLQRFGFKNHILVFFNKDDVMTYKAQSLIDGRVAVKPKPIKVQDDLVLKFG